MKYEAKVMIVDKSANVYIKMDDGIVERTVEKKHAMVTVDLDNEDNIVGIEVVW